MNFNDSSALEDSFSNLNAIFNTSANISSPDDLEDAQLNFLASNTSINIVSDLISKHYLNPPVVLETLLLIYDDPSICNIDYFPFSLLFISIEKYTKCIEDLCVSREEIFINILYRLHYSRSSFRDFEFLLELPCALKYLENHSLWGLDRKRVGVLDSEDITVKAFYLKKEVNICQISQINSIQKQIFHGTEKIELAMKNPYLSDGEIREMHLFEYEPRLKKINNGRAILRHIVYYEDVFAYPCFLDNLLNKFPNDTELSKPTIDKELEITANNLFNLIFPLLKNQKIKSNFMKMVENVYNQDRTKITFEEKNNCSDEHVYNLASLLIKVMRDTFRLSFIEKIGKIKFATWGFFHISRMLEISLVKLVENIRTKNNSQNSFFLIRRLQPDLQIYLNFVYDIFERRADEIYKPLLEAIENQSASEESDCPNNGKSFETNDKKGLNSLNKIADSMEISENENENDCDYENDLLNSCTKLLDFTLNDKKAIFLDEILYDSSFISSIINVQSILPVEEARKAILPFLSRFFIYKNTFKNTAIRILYLLDNIDNITLKRIVRHYSDPNNPEVVDDRYMINKIIKKYPLEVNPDSLRLANALVADFEERMSSVATSINNIKESNNKIIKFKELIDDDDVEEFAISDDEENIGIPEERIQLLSRLNEEQLRLYFRGENEDEEIYRKIKQLLKHFHNKFKYKLVKKLILNEHRLNRTEMMLKGSITMLESILDVLTKLIRTSKKLFLNRNIFNRFCQILNRAFFTLVGPGCASLLISNKENYNFNPGEILRQISILAIEMIAGKPNLARISGLDSKMLERAMKICQRKFLLKEDQLEAGQKLCELLSEVEEAPSEMDVPEEFMDPLTFTLMENPVKLTTSNTIIDKSTFNQIMLNDRVDPFSRLPLDEKCFISHTELKEKIEEFKKNFK